jgi:serine/threonine-protein kinase
MRPRAVAFDRKRSPTDTAKIIVAIALEMVYLHAQNVLHHDPKPANVLIDQVMHLRICDFGQSNVCGCNVTQTAGRGTPLCMAPDMSTEDHYGRPMDVFTCACMTYQLITGKNVLNGNKPIPIAHAANSEVRPSIPREWRSELTRMMRRASTITIVIVLVPQNVDEKAVNHAFCLT